MFVRNTSDAEKDEALHSVGESTAVLALVGQLDRIDDEYPLVSARVLN